MKITLELTAKEVEDLVNLMYEKGMELEDDGHEGDPSAKLLYRVAKQIKGGK
jgi:hypothetical protein